MRQCIQNTLNYYFDISNIELYNIKQYHLSIKGKENNDLQLIGMKRIIFILTRS